MVCGAKLLQDQALNMDIADYSEDEEQRSYSHCGGGGRFGARWQKPRSKSHHQLLLMDSVGNGNGSGGVDGDGGASEDQDILPLPEYERLSQSARLPDDPNPRNPLLPEYQCASPPPPPPMPRPQKKPAAWRLIQYVRSRNKSGGPGGCGSSDGDSRSSDGEKDGDDGGGVEKHKKRSSWLPDRERRWPVQGFYGEKEGDEGGGEDGKKEEKDKKRSSWLPDPERRWPVQGFY